MSKRALNKKGFTLLEIIISLVLVGIVTAVIGVSSNYLVNSFLFSGKNADTLLKGQVAMARMAKELNNIKTVYVASTNGTQIKFTSYRDAVAVDHLISWGGSGTNLLFDGDILADQVSSFSLAYYNDYTGSGTSSTWLVTSRIIEINLELKGAENTTAKFNDRVAPSFDVKLIGP